MTPQNLALRGLNVLVIDDERELRESLSHALAAMGHRTLEAGDAESGLALIKERGVETPASIAMVLLDVNLPGMSGLEALREIREFDPSIQVLIITAHGNIRDAVEAMREGAYNYIEKPVQEADLSDIVRRASEAHALVQETRLSSPKIALDGGQQFLGASPSMLGFPNHRTCGHGQHQRPDPRRKRHRQGARRARRTL
jgi:DNA-binding NtrC family response regulator